MWSVGCDTFDLELLYKIHEARPGTCSIEGRVVGSNPFRKAGTVHFHLHYRQERTLMLPFDRNPLKHNQWNCILGMKTWAWMGRAKVGSMTEFMRLQGRTTAHADIWQRVPSGKMIHKAKPQKENAGRRQQLTSHLKQSMWNVPSNARTNCPVSGSPHFLHTFMMAWSDVSLFTVGRDDGILVFV
jgi:hypothetical protein